jgi:hypothetical protein
MTNSLPSRCACARCRIHSLMGPVILILVGILFLIGRFTEIGFHQLWPVLLVVIGVFLLIESTASREGHGGV